MKKMQKTSSTLLAIAIVVIAITFNACKKANIIPVMEPAPTTNPTITNHNTRAAINSAPVAPGYTPNSIAGINLTGPTGTYSGGVIKAQVISFDGTTLITRITKQNGTAFTNSGTTIIFRGSVCGTQVTSVTFSAGATAINCTTSVSLNRGILHFYPVIRSNNGGGYYYAEPIMIWTSPWYNTGALYNGFLYGTANSVNVLCSGPTNLSTTSANQCTNFCKNYYSAVYGLNFPSPMGNAVDWNVNYSAKGLVRYANGGSMAPRVGDILVFSGNTYGHVMIVVEVGFNYVKVAQQNSGGAAPIGFEFSRSGNSVSSAALGAGYNCLSWLRKP